MARRLYVGRRPHDAGGFYIVGGATSGDLEQRMGGAHIEPEPVTPSPKTILDEAPSAEPSLVLPPPLVLGSSANLSQPLALRPETRPDVRSLAPAPPRPRRRWIAVALVAAALGAGAAAVEHRHAHPTQQQHHP